MIVPYSAGGATDITARVIGAKLTEKWGQQRYITERYGLITGPRVPAPIVQKRSAAIVEAVRAPDAVQRLTADGSEIVGSTPGQFGAHIRNEIAKWSRLVKETNLALQ
jgi:tripartite-type tricarboxylate transporter receptor subunit TctC